MTQIHIQRIQLQQAQAISQISSQVLHDIKSPLGTLDVALDALENKTEQSVRLINAALKRIKEIVKDLEQVQNEKPIDSVDVAVVNINELLDEVLMEKKVECPGVDIDFDWGSSMDALPVKIHGGDFKRVISNMVNNSVEAMTTEPGEISVKAFRKGGAVCIRIQDNGRGVPRRVRQRLFEKQVTCGKKSGRGLGLYHARRKMREWQGDLRLCQSPEGGGALFLLQLPLVS